VSEPVYIGSDHYGGVPELDPSRCGGVPSWTHGGSRVGHDGEVISGRWEGALAHGNCGDNRGT